MVTETKGILNTDNLFQILSALMDECCDDFGPAGDGCSRCLCRRSCQRLIDSINQDRLTMQKFHFYKREFRKLKSRRQIMMDVIIS